MYPKLMIKYHPKYIPYHLPLYCCRTKIYRAICKLIANKYQNISLEIIIMFCEIQKISKYIN